MKVYPSLTNYIEAVTVLSGRLSTLPALSPMLDENGVPMYRTKGGLLFFPVLDSSGKGFTLGFFLNSKGRDKFSAKPNQRLITDEFFVHTSSQGVYVDVVFCSENHDVAPKRNLNNATQSPGRELIEGLRAFCDPKTKLWGFMNACDAVVIEPSWHWVDDFAEGRAVVKRDDMFGLIDTKANVVIAATFDDLSWDGSQYAYVECNGLWGVVDRNGHTILPMKWEWVGEFANNFFIIQDNQLFGYANKDGHVVIEPKYHDAGSFNQFGAAWVRIDDNEFFIDHLERRV